MQEKVSKKTIKHALLVMIICYLPHLISSPWWLSILVVSAIVYRVSIDHYGYGLPNVWARLFLVIVSLCLLFLQYKSQVSSGFYIGFLLVFVALKSLEIRTVRDLRVLVLCDFYMILTALLIHQELWVFLYVILAVVAILLLMMKITAPVADFQYSGKKLIKRFFLALPIAIFLFYLFPRLSNPLWRVPALVQAKTGFSEQMTMGNLSDVVNDDSTVMRVVFRSNFKPSFYWRGLVLSAFNGWTWTLSPEVDHPFELLKPIKTGQAASYEILLEPHQKKWLFYQDNPIASYPGLLFSSSQGLVQQDSRVIYQRVDYSIIDGLSRSYQPLTKASYQLNTYLPPNGNPRLREWAKQQIIAVHGNTQALIDAIGRHINQEPYWYSLMTKNIGIKANLMDHFWFDTKQGYCEYYTGAVAIILRAVGIPTRVIVGYHGGLWNPIAQYLTVQQNDAHAWLEYWLDGVGWQRMDPVSFIAHERIDARIQQKQAGGVEQEWNSSWNMLSSKLPWMARAAFFLESAQFFWERWLLFYNQDSQLALLQKIGLGQWDEIKLLQVFIIVLLLLMLTGGIWYSIRQRQVYDALLVEYHRLQQEMQRLDVETRPPATFSKQLQELGDKQFHLKPLLNKYAEQYEQLRLRQEDANVDNRQSILTLLRSLRMKLKKIAS